MIMDHERLRELVRAICIGGGSEPEEARQVADQLVEANLTGHDSHGAGRMPLYVEALGDGRLYANRHVKVMADNGAILILDGRAGYGQVLAGEAMALGIERVREIGVCLVVLRNAGHVGRVGAWAEKCLEAGYASMHYVNSTAHEPLVVPFGGIDARLSTNPFCAAMPSAKGLPVVLDMATSVVAEGKIHVAHNKGRAVPDGTLVDAEGRPTNDPGVLYREPRGSMVPMGAYKGYGLGLICELFAGALGGGGTMQPEWPRADQILNHMLSIIIDPAALGDPAACLREADAAVAWVKASRPAPGCDGVMVAGDPERRARAERLANGIEIDDETWRQILEAAESVGVAPGRIAEIVGTGSPRGVPEPAGQV